MSTGEIAPTVLDGMSARRARSRTVSAARARNADRATARSSGVAMVRGSTVKFRPEGTWPYLDLRGLSGVVRTRWCCDVPFEGRWVPWQGWCGQGPGQPGSRASTALGNSGLPCRCPSLSRESPVLRIGLRVALEAAGAVVHRERGLVRGGRSGRSPRDASSCSTRRRPARPASPTRGSVRTLVKVGHRVVVHTSRLHRSAARGVVRRRDRLCRPGRPGRAWAS